MKINAINSLQDMVTEAFSMIDVIGMNITLYRKYVKNYLLLLEVRNMNQLVQWCKKFQDVDELSFYTDWFDGYVLTFNLDEMFHMMDNERNVHQLTDFCIKNFETTNINKAKEKAEKKYGLLNHEQIVLVNEQNYTIHTEFVDVYRYIKKQLKQWLGLY